MIAGRQRRRARPRVAARRRRRGGDRHRATATGACSPSATRPPTCWPRRCSTCSPGPRSPSGRRSRTASTTTSSSPGRRRRPRSSPTTSSASRPGCARSSPSRSRSSATRSRPTRPARSFADHPFKLEIIDGAGRRPDVGHRAGPGAHLREPASSRRTSRRSTGYPASSTSAAGPTSPTPDRPRALQADAGRRRLLAGRREEPDAAAHLRHGVGVEEGPRAATCTASRRPPSATTASSAPSSTCSRSPTRSARASRCSTPRAASSAG